MERKSINNENVRLENDVSNINQENTVLAYIGAIVDGEGCLEIQKGKLKNREVNNSYRLRFRVHNTDRRLINFMNIHFPGVVSSTIDKRKNRRIVYEWGCSGTKAEKYITDIRKYLLIKKEQADACLSLRQTYGKYFGIFGMDEKTLQERETIYKKICLLKHIDCSSVDEYKFDDIITDEDVAYAAGIIDGEGSIRIDKYKPSHLKNKHYRLTISVNNTDRKLIDFLYCKFGGSKSFTSAKGNKRSQLAWNTSSRDGHRFLQKIYPYSVIKKEQMETIFEFMKTYDIKYGYGKSIPEEVVNERERLHQKCKDLKQLKGIINE